MNGEIGMRQKKSNILDNGGCRFNPDFVVVHIVTSALIS
jgi:hypothetical protein